LLAADAQVRNIIFPGYASSYPLQSAYVTSFDGANATALRQELASVIGAQGYISENATAALMIRSMLFNADDGSYYSCGFMFEDSRCGSLIPSARYCAVGFLFLLRRSFTRDNFCCPPDALSQILETISLFLFGGF